MGKYQPLGDFLRAQAQNEIVLSFQKIEEITGAKLPFSAKRYRAWWSNNSQNSVMTRVWLDAGFESERVDMKSQMLVFRRRSRARMKNAPSRATIASASRNHPLYGWLKGTVRIAPGVDLTEPADPEWGKSVAE